MLPKGPIFLRSTFTITGEPRDTFLDTTGWGKGMAYVNAHVVGRYWPSAGPQSTLYVPATFLKTGLNMITLLELEYVPSEKQMTLQTTPIYTSRNVLTYGITD